MRAANVIALVVFFGRFFFSPSSLAAAVKQCSLKEGGGTCPHGNTCCPLKGGGSGCIANDMGSLNATCCTDGLTGCAVGYTCQEEKNECHATSRRTDPLVQTMPRYILCHPPPGTLSTVYGFPVVKDAKLAYYSSHGNILLQGSDRSHIQMALIVIHGAGRNADDYYCSATAAAQLQKTYPPESILVVVPRFLSISDDPVELSDGGVPMQWGDQGDGPWRYGAQAVSPPCATNISSFAAVDRIIQILLDSHFPNLTHVTIAGHSSGGQFVQRYSLLTSSWVSNRMSAVVANPSNYAYLTPLRMLNGTWRIPTNRDDDDCPQYNRWEYGLEPGGGDMVVPYRDRALKMIGNNITTLMERFNNRRVTYLAGACDRCNVSESQGHDGWCFSHGLETSCADMVQGANRWERSANYFSSLQRLGITTHRRHAVPDVGHDHSLIFTSRIGLSVLFPKDWKGENVETGQ